MALTLYMHPLASYCWKVLIALYENATPFTPHVVDLGDPQAKAAFVALWPTAKIPLLQDTTRDRIIPETSIMIEYLDRHYPGRQPLLPSDADARLEARLWDRLFDAYVMTPMQDIVASRLRPAEYGPQRVSAATETLHMAYDMIETHLAQRAWAAGDAFSLADCAAAPALFYSSIVVPFAASHVQLAAYLERLLARPSVARTIDEARPYFQYFPFKDAMPARFLAERIVGDVNMRAQSSQRLDEVFHALADTTRRRMIDRLSDGPASVSELAQPLDMALPSVVKHLAVLEAGGLVMSEKTGRVRTYRIAPDAIAAVESWLAARKARWNAQFDRLDAYLAAAKPSTRRRKRQ